MSAVADDLAETIAGIRLALQAANAAARVPDVPVQPRWPDPSKTSSSEPERVVARLREDDELERDIERLWQEKKQLESDIAQTAQRHRFQTGRGDDDGMGGAGEKGGADMPVRASAPRATRAARPQDNPHSAPHVGGEKAGGDHRVFLSGLGNSVAREIPTAVYRRNDLPATSPGWEEDADTQFFPNGHENRPFLRAARPLTEHLDPSNVDINSYGSMAPELLRHARGMSDSAGPSPQDTHAQLSPPKASNNWKLPPAPVPLQRPQRSHGAPDSAPGNNEWPHRAKKGIWQLVPDYAPDAREAEFSDYSDYGVLGGSASDPVNNSHEAEMVYSDYGGTYSLQDLKIQQHRPKQVQFKKNHLALPALQDDARNRDRVSPRESSLPANPKAPTLLQRPDDKSQEGVPEVVTGQLRSLRAASAPSLAADAFNVELLPVVPPREQLFSDYSQPIHRPTPGATATYSQSTKAPARRDTTTLSPATCECLFSTVLSDDLPVVDQTGAMFHHGTITVHAHSRDRPQHLEQPVGIFRTEETDEDLAGEGDRLAMEVQRRMVEAATRKMNDALTTNVPDVSPSKQRSSGRFSIQPTLPPVEESMEEEDEDEKIESLRHRLESMERAIFLEQEEEYISGGKMLVPVKDPHEDLIEQYLHLSPATVPLDAQQPPSPIARDAAAPIVQTVAAAPRVQRAAAPPAPSNLAQIEREEEPFRTGSELPARPAGIPAHYVPAPFPEPHGAHQMTGQTPKKTKNAGLSYQRLVATEALDSPHHAPPPRIADPFGDNAPMQPPSDSVTKDRNHAARGSIAHPDSASMSDEQRHGAGGSRKQLLSAQAGEEQFHGFSPGANNSNPETLTSSPSSCISEPGSVKELPSNCVSQIVSVTAAEGAGQALSSSSETLPIHRSPHVAPLHQLHNSNNTTPPPVQDFSSLEAINGDSPTHSILTREDRKRLGGSLGPATVAYFPPPDDVECLSSPPQTQPAKPATQDSPTAPTQSLPLRPGPSPPPSQPMSAPTNSALSWQIAANQVVVESDSEDEITVGGDENTVAPSSNLPCLPGLFNQLPATSSHALESRSNVQTRSKGVEDYEEAGAPLHPTMLDEEITDDFFLQAIGFKNDNTNGEPPSHLVEGGPPNKKRMPAFTTTAKHSPGPVGVSDVIGNLFRIGAAQSSGAGRVQSASHIVVESVLL